MKSTSTDTFDYQANESKWHYSAPKPEWTATDSRNWWTLRICLFPVFLVWESLKFVFNLIFGRLLSYVLLPSQMRPIPTGPGSVDEGIHTPKSYLNKIIKPHLNQLYDADCAWNHSNVKIKQRMNEAGELEDYTPPRNILEAFEYKQFRVDTHDDYSLDTLQLCPKHLADRPISDQKYIIYFNPNGCSHYDALSSSNLRDGVRDALRLGATAISFDQRGVMFSKTDKHDTHVGGGPWSFDNLVTDGIAQVQRLLDMGVPSENIMLYGMSLGAGIATLTARHFKRHGLNMYLFNEQSFSNVTNTAIGLLMTQEDGHSRGWFATMMGYLLKPVVKGALLLTGWEAEVADAYRELDDEFKDYASIRSTKLLREDGAHDDGLITHFASLHDELKSDRQWQLDEAERQLTTKDSSEDSSQDDPTASAIEACKVPIKVKQRAHKFTDISNYTIFANRHLANTPANELEVKQREALVDVIQKGSDNNMKQVLQDAADTTRLDEAESSYDKDNKHCSAGNKVKNKLGQTLDEYFLKFASFEIKPPTTLPDDQPGVHSASTMTA